MEKEQHINEIKCIRALDKLIPGVSIVFILLIFSRLLLNIPILWIKYLYLIPILFVFITIMNIPSKLYSGDRWINALGRLRLFAFIALGFSPFWIWWHSNLNSGYFLINTGIFVFAQICCLYNMVLIVAAATEEDGNKIFYLFCRFARIALIYTMIAPMLALFIIVWLVQRSGSEVVILLYQIQGWDLMVLGGAFVPTVYVLWHWRKNLVHNMAKRDE